MQQPHMHNQHHQHQQQHPQMQQPFAVASADMASTPPPNKKK
jgi:hypothetical protein